MRQRFWIQTIIREMRWSIIQSMKFHIQESLSISILNLEPRRQTVISREYPVTWKKGDEPYYPVNDEKNTALYAKYKELAEKEENVIFGGRLGLYRYMDMHHVVDAALQAVREEMK